MMTAVSYEYRQIWCTTSSNNIMHVCRYIVYLGYVIHQIYKIMHVMRWYICMFYPLCNRCLVPLSFQPVKEINICCEGIRAATLAVLPGYFIWHFGCFPANAFWWNVRQSGQHVVRSSSGYILLHKKLLRPYFSVLISAWHFSITWWLCCCLS